jgi:pimeloyl-ACP methyl ester carboxylesterase
MMGSHNIRQVKFPKNLTAFFSSPKNLLYCLLFVYKFGYFLNDRKYTPKEQAMPTLKIKENQILHYQLLEGDPALPYLVFLHEGLGCTAMWRDFPELLCKTTGCPGLVYDRLGYGKSSASPQRRTIHYLHTSALHELPKLLHGVIPETPYILVGHSDGGSISLIHGAERPFFLRGIIAEAAHVFVDQATIAGIKSAAAAWAQGKLQGLAHYHGEKTAAVFKAWAETWLSAWFRHWNIEYLLPSITAPLLVIHGENDQYGLIEQAKSIASHTAGHVQLEIVTDCAHIPHAEAQPLVEKLMTDFIAQVTKGR